MIRRAPRPADTFTRIDNRTIEDPQLSFKALGLLVYLLSKPDHWRVDRDHLAATHTDGVSSVRSGLRELAAAGYLRTEATRDEAGRLIGREAVVYDRPVVVTDGGDRMAENQPVENQPVENRPLRVRTEGGTTDVVPTTSATADAAAGQLPLGDVGPQEATQPVDTPDPLALPWKLVREAYDARGRKPIESRPATVKVVRRLLDAGWTEAQLAAALRSSPAWTPTSLQVELSRNGGQPRGGGGGRARALADDPRRHGESRVVNIAEEIRRGR